MNKKTLVIGVSEHRHRYAYEAVGSLLRQGHEVVALGLHQGNIHGIEIETEKKQYENIHTITLYINRQIQQEQYHDYILQLKPKRIIFNPGAENPTLAKLAQEQGIETENACTLVLLSSGQY